MCDPERLKKLKAGVVVCKDSANRWTENCQLMISYFKKKGVEMDQAVRQPQPQPTLTTAHLTGLPAFLVVCVVVRSLRVLVRCCGVCVCVCVVTRKRTSTSGCRRIWMCLSE